MAHPYPEPVSARRPRRRPPPASAAINGTRPAVTLERVLALPIVDRLLGRALHHPRLMQLLGALAGLVIIAFALRPLFVLSGSGVVAMPVQASGSATAPAVTPGAGVDQRGTSSGEDEVVAVVAAYNQASITAALLGRADVMAPYLAPDGTAWAEVQAEYQRRQARGETHDPALTRWGILRTEINDATATVETQEQWDDIASLGGQVISSRRGVLTRNSYELRRPSAQGRWLITSVTSITVIG